jgi:hypothetical protein
MVTVVPPAAGPPLGKAPVTIGPGHVEGMGGVTQTGGAGPGSAPTATAADEISPPAATSAVVTPTTISRRIDVAIRTPSGGEAVESTAFTCTCGAAAETSRSPPNLDERDEADLLLCSCRCQYVESTLRVCRRSTGRRSVREAAGQACQDRHSDRLGEQPAHGGRGEALTTTSSLELPLFTARRGGDGMGAAGHLATAVVLVVRAPSPAVPGHRISPSRHRGGRRPPSRSGSRPPKAPRRHA